MESRAKLLGHPVHQMLVTFPIGAFALAVTSDVLHGWTGKRKYAGVANVALDFGLASAVIAAPFGTVDWFAIEKGTRAKRVGLWHAVGNVAMLGLFTASRWLRSRDTANPTAKYLAGAAFAVGGVTAWLGGELVDRHGVGVSEGAGLNASSSLESGARAPTARDLSQAAARVPVSP